MGRKIIAVWVALFCIGAAASAICEADGANVIGTANTPTTYCTKNFFVKEGGIYKMSRGKCPMAGSAEVVCVAATIIDPGTLLVWPEKDAKEPAFRALTYAGIQNDEIVLTRDPGPSIRLPIKGVFTKYGILDIAGHRIILDVVHPDKIQAKVGHAAKRCRCK